MFTWQTLRHPLRRNPVRHRRADPRNFAGIPERLLYDMGMSRDGVPSLARQLRAGQERC